MKRILVPTDFSDCARAAENFGMYLARKAKAEICFLHLQSTPVDWVKLSLEKEKLYPETKAQIASSNSELEKLKRRAEKMGVKAEHSLIFNKGREEIDKVLKVGRYDFVVMGSHGADGFKELMGTNTQRVIRYSPVPVFVVKRELKRNELRDIVFASTFDENVLPAFRQVQEFSRLFNSKLHLLFVNTPYYFKGTKEAEADMETFVRKASTDVKYTKHIYSAHNQEFGIQNFSMDIRASAIAVVTHGKTGIARTFSHSVSESLVNHSEIPILSLNMKQK